MGCRTLIEIRYSRPEDVNELDRTKREKDNQEAENLGTTFKQALTVSYQNAVFRKTVLVNGEVSAMFGVTNSPDEGIHGVYFITGTGINKLSKFQFVRVYLEELKKLSTLFKHLISLVDSQYKEAVKLIEIAGFQKTEERKVNENIFYVYELKV